MSSLATLSPDTLFANFDLYNPKIEFLFRGYEGECPQRCPVKNLNSQFDLEYTRHQQDKARLLEEQLLNSKRQLLFNSIQKSAETRLTQLTTSPQHPELSQELRLKFRVPRPPTSRAEKGMKSVSRIRPNNSLFDLSKDRLGGKLCISSETRRSGRSRIGKNTTLTEFLEEVKSRSVLEFIKEKKRHLTGTGQGVFSTEKYEEGRSGSARGERSNSGLRPSKHLRSVITQCNQLNDSNWPSKKLVFTTLETSINEPVSDSHKLYFIPRDLLKKLKKVVRRKSNLERDIK